MKLARRFVSRPLRGAVARHYGTRAMMSGMNDGSNQIENSEMRLRFAITDCDGTNENVSQTHRGEENGSAGIAAR